MPSPCAGVWLWKMNSTAFYAKRFSGPGGFRDSKIREAELEKLNRVCICILTLNAL